MSEIKPGEPGQILVSDPLTGKPEWVYLIKPGYLRVSQVLSAFSGLDKIDPVVLKNAADRGSVVHAAIDSIIAHHGILDLEDQVREYTKCESLIEWHDKFVKELALVQNMIESFKIYAKDKKFFAKVDRFYDDELMITGECDTFYQVDKQIFLVDFKTPISESKTWMLQGSAYHYLALRNRINFPDNGKIEFVKLCRKGNAPKSYFYEPRFDLFKATLETYRYFKLEGCQDQEIDYL
jgi:hypothetical protein